MSAEERRIGDVTSTAVMTVERSMSLLDVAAELTNNDVGFAVVDEGGSVAGVISERDIVLAIAEGSALEDTRVEEVMATDLVSVAATADLRTAARVMLDNGVRHLLVTGDEPGVVSVRDVLAGLIDD